MTKVQLETVSESELKIEFLTFYQHQLKCCKLKMLAYQVTMILSNFMLKMSLGLKLKDKVETLERIYMIFQLKY